MGRTARSSGAEPRRVWRRPARAEQVSDLRRQVGEFVTASGLLSPSRVDDLKLALSEALTKALVHGYRGGGEGELVVSVSAEDRVEMTIEDEGVGMTPHPDSPGLRMGLALIAMLADSLDVRPLKPSGTELRVIFDPSA